MAKREKLISYTRILETNLLPEDEAEIKLEIKRFDRVHKATMAEDPYRLQDKTERAEAKERIAARRKEASMPSDFDGVVYISLESGGWKAGLARELKAAGYAIDWNKVMA